MVHEILTKDLDQKWVTTKWVSHKLNDLHKANRVTRCQDLIESLSSRLAKKKIITIDEKFFYCRNMKRRNVVGSWIVPSGDEKRR